MVLYVLIERLRYFCVLLLLQGLTPMEKKWTRKNQAAGFYSPRFNPQFMRVICKNVFFVLLVLFYETVSAERGGSGFCAFCFFIFARNIITAAVGCWLETRFPFFWLVCVVNMHTEKTQAARNIKKMSTSSDQKKHCLSDADTYSVDLD